MIGQGYHLGDCCEHSIGGFAVSAHSNGGCVILSLLVLELSAFVKGAIEGFLSSLALMIFFAILPLVSISQEGV